MFDLNLLHLFTVLLSGFVMRTNSYCPGPGANPSFVQGPKVKQVSLTSVVLTWEGLVKQGECADQFLVKWWNRNDPGSYELSDMLATSTTIYQVNGLAPHRSYAFQVIAREDRGWLGADWNKSPIVYFTTTRPNPTVAPPVTPKDVKHPKVDDREPNDEYEYSGLNNIVAPPVTPKDVKYPRSGPCEDNKVGPNCESCARGFYGFYGDAYNGGSCEACPCPDGGACIEIIGSPRSPFCTECPDGRNGARCEFCDSGYYGDPLGQRGEIRECRKCQCNNNVDESVVGNCDTDSGQCLRCIFDTAGWNCDKCNAGFHGDALALHQPGQEQNCQPCNCYPKGAYTTHNITYPALKCDDRTGRCDCKPNVEGRDCDRCKDGYFNIDSKLGCDPCNCDSSGSLNYKCHINSGQCHCRLGVTGQRCDQCKPNHYDFSMEGCKPCNCDPSGSTDLQCNAFTGQCPCKNNMEGRLCNQRQEMEMLDDISAEISLMRTNMDQISSMKSDMDEIKDKLDNLIHQFEEMRDTHFLPRTSQNP